MKYIYFALLFLLLACKSNDYELVWSDEFDYVGLPDSTRWSWDVEGNKWSWGNNELQHYTAFNEENAWVENGQLYIRALKDTSLQTDYTSARLITKGKGDWLYGRIEVKAKVPGGKGAWPAIWMLPTDWEYGGWPKSGEIDIMEHVGYAPDSLFFTVHTGAFNHIKGTHKSAAVYSPGCEAGFHVYAIDWEKDRIDFLLDGHKVYTYKKEGDSSDVWPFDKRFHLLLNLAIGGDWGGKHGVDNSIFPLTMQVDYVRVYQRVK